MTDTKQLIRVVDIPAGATAEETEQLLNAPYGEGYYLMHLWSMGTGTGAARGTSS